MEFRMLGPLELRRNTEVVRLGGARRRAVLAGLLFRANEVASIGYLAEAAWERAPAAAGSAVRAYVAAIRRWLREHGEDDALLTTEPGGYRLRILPGELDLGAFEELADRGGRAFAEGDFPATVDHLRRALGLWRGEPLEGLNLGPALRTEMARLSERRLSASEQEARARLELGEDHALIGDLRRLTGRYPLREGLQECLMLALYRAGRQAEALAAYQRIRRMLIDELGIEPGERLRHVHHVILSEEPEGAEGRQAAAPANPVTVTPPPPPPAPARQVVRYQLPMDITEFTGRERELRHLHALADRAAADTTTEVVICAIEGMAGVGKTRLAIHAAHEMARRGGFADFQLWADLRGFDPVRPPSDPARILDGFLRLLGVPGEQIPHDIDEQGALYRHVLHDRAALVALDNAASADQIRPLLPGTANSLVLVTSRRHLSGLDGVTYLPVEVFSPEDAAALLNRIAGTERVAAEPDSAARVVAACGGLPLAIALAARQLQRRPAWTLAHLADRFVPATPRSVRASFELSYEALPAASRRMFRLISLVPGQDVTAGLAAAVIGTEPASAEDLLEQLLDDHLLQQVTTGRYEFHDLTREYARQQAHRHESARAQASALHRVVAWQLHATASADRALDPNRRHVEPDTAYRPGHVPAFGSHQAALDWLDAEFPNVVAAAGAAARRGWHRLTWQLPAALLGYLYLRKHWNDWLALHETALESARSIGDVRGQAWALHGLGLAYSDLRRYDEAIRCHRRAIELDRTTGDRTGEAWNLNSLGVIYVDLDRCEQAVATLHRAVVLHRSTGGQHGEALSLNNLGDAHRRLGDLDRAKALLDLALARQRDTGDHHGERYTLGTLGDMHHDMNQHRRAIRAYQRAKTISDRLGDHWHSALISIRMSHAYRDAGHHDVAATIRQAALTYLDGIHDPQADRLRASLDGTPAVRDGPGRG